MELAGRQSFIPLIGAAYLLGSVPFGLLVGWVRGIDVRKGGSGNIGATNVGRLLGRRYFFVVFILDLFKSLIPMVAGGVLSRHVSRDQTTYVLWLAAGLAAVFGHMHSIFLGFKGGKGVATSAGVMIGLWPFYTLPSLIAISIFLITLYAARYMSVASMAGAVTFPFAYLAIALGNRWDPLGRQLPLLLAALLIPVFIIHKHRANIARLRAGTESKIGGKKDAVAIPEAGGA